jgi:hypothetical protein
VQRTTRPRSSVGHPWHDNTIICRRAHFDGLILSHWFHIRSRHWVCSLSMARAVNPMRSLKLGEALALEYKLPPKIVPYDLFKGLRASRAAGRWPI